MISALFTMVSSTVKFSETAESYGWMQTGHLIGAAVGSALAGIVIDIMGPIGGIAMSVLFLVLTVAVAAATHRFIPDLRGVDASPIPDTEPIQIPVGLPTQPISLPEFTQQVQELATEDDETGERDHA